MNSDGLVCYCLGIPRLDIEREARGEAPPQIEARIRAFISSGQCTCETTNPSGRCCLADVRQILNSASADDQARGSKGKSHECC